MKNRIFKIDYFGGGYSEKEWFDLGLEAFIDEAPSSDLRDYDYIQIIPLSSYKRHFFSNDGTQAFRHRETGWTMPDYCRQRGGCPEMWERSRRRNLEISEGSPVWDFIVVR